MKKSDLVRIYNEKFGNDDMLGGIEQKRLTERLNKIRNILKKVLEDPWFIEESTHNERVFYKEVIKPLLKSTDVIAEESKDFFLPLVRYHDSNIFKYLKIEYCSDKYLEKVSDIKEVEVEQFLSGLNDSHVKLNDSIDIGKIRRYMQKDSQCMNISSEIKEIILRIDSIKDGFSCAATCEEERIEELMLEGFKGHQNYNYLMSLITYYRLCNCIV